MEGYTSAREIAKFMGEGVSPTLVSQVLYRKFSDLPVLGHLRLVPRDRVSDVIAAVKATQKMARTRQAKQRRQQERAAKAEARKQWWMENHGCIPEGANI
jgi:hypothetical protein